MANNNSCTSDSENDIVINDIDELVKLDKHLKKHVAEQFQINKLHEHLVKKQSQGKQKSIYTKCPYQIIYRGQANASWSLQPSFFRKIKDTEISVEYFNMILIKAYKELASRGKIMHLEIENEIDYDRLDTVFAYTPNREIMLYLRHCGFPTPVMDWSQSIWIALFFAYHRADDAKQNENVSIYFYCDFNIAADIVGKSSTKRVTGDFIITHERHDLQRSEYTYALLQKDSACSNDSSKKFDSYYHCDDNKSHLNISKITHHCDRSFFLYKAILPASWRDDVLKMLYEERNINAYKLYNNEESLFECVSTKMLQKYMPN